MTWWQQNGAERDARGPLSGARLGLARRGAAALSRLRWRVTPARVWPSPQGARCFSCGATHVLLPAGLVLRRADTVEVIGTALAVKARGSGHRTIAARLGRPASTVRRWLRRTREPHADWLHEQGVQHAYRADPDILNRDLV